MAKKRKKKKAKPKIEQIEEKSEESETPVIEGEQAGIQPEKGTPDIGPKNEVQPPEEGEKPESKPTNGPVDKTEETAPKVTPPDETPKPTRMPTSIDDIPVTKRPVVAKEPEYVEPAHPVTCSGCKAIVDSSTIVPCLLCPKSLVYCPACAKAGTCHKCGKKLDPNED